MTEPKSGTRSFVAGVLLTVGVLLIPVTLLSQWVQNYVLNTENFVETFEPVAENTAFQDYLATELSEATASAVEDSAIANLAENVTGSVDGFLSQFGLDLGLEETASDWASELANEAASAVYDESLPALRSPQFVEAWNQAILQIHSQVVSGLLDPGPETQTIMIDVAPFVGIVEEYLDQSGFTFARYLPNLAVEASVPVVEVTYTPAWRSFASVTVEYGKWIPWVNGIILALGLVVARSRWTSLARTSFAAAFMSGLVWLTAPLLGGWVISDVALPNDEVSFAKELWQMLSQPLVDQALMVAAISLVVGLLALLAHLLIKRI